MTDLPLKPMYPDAERKLGIPLILVFAAIGAVVLSWWIVQGNRREPSEGMTVTYYVRTATRSHVCPSPECAPDALFERGDAVGGLSDAATNADWVAIRLEDEDERTVHLPRQALTDERPARVMLLRASNAYACPATSCAVRTTFPAGTSFLVFSEDIQDGWFRVEVTSMAAGDASEVIEYYLPTAAFTETAEPTPVPIEPEPASASESDEEAQAVAWRISDEPSTVWTITDTPLYACPEADCDVVARLPAGLYLRLGYTLAPDGWVRTRYGQEGSRGYLSAGNLSTAVPERCRHRMTYALAHIGQRFLDAGFTRQELETLLRDAEREVEEAVGWDFLQLTDGARSTVNFVISHYRDAEESHRGLHVPETAFPDEVVASFWIGIYAALLDDVESAVTNEYIAPSQRKDVAANIIHQTLIHELVHTTGFGHHEDPTGVMCGEPNCRPASVDFAERQSLRPVDLEAITEWCHT